MSHINITSATHERKVPQGKLFENLPTRSLKTALKIKKLIPTCAQSVQFFEKSGDFLSIFKKG